MIEPSRSTSRRVIAGAALAVLAVAGAGFALGRSTAEPEPMPVAPAPAPAPTPSPVLPAQPPLLGRGDLIAAARMAADAYGSGRPLPPALADLAGREFQVRLPFGCAPRPGDGSRLSWTYDEAEQALRVRVEPVQWSAAEWLGEAATGAEAVEGFWIERPWTVSETCPPAPPAPSQPAPSPTAKAGEPKTPTPSLEPAPEPTPTAARTAPAPVEPTLGIAQFFAPGSSRIGRREGRPFQAVEAIAPEALDLSQGLRLRLRGEIAASPAGGPVLCRGPADRPPRCLIAARLNEVAIENPATGMTIATWDVASRGADGRE